MKFGKKLGPIKYFKNYCIRNNIRFKEIDEYNTYVKGDIIEYSIKYIINTKIK